MAKGVRVTIRRAALRTAIRQHYGNVSAIATAFGVSWDAIKDRIDADPVLKRELEISRERMLDNAESVLYTKVLAGATPELLFFLKTQGKKRGYIEKSELSITDDVVYEIKWGDERSADPDPGPASTGSSGSS